MSGHVEAFTDCVVSFGVGSTKGPFAYPGHQLGDFMRALEKALNKVTFGDPVFKRERHAIKAARVVHVAPNLDYLRKQLVLAAQGKYGDIAQSERPRKSPSRKRSSRMTRRRSTKR